MENKGGNMENLEHENNIKQKIEDFKEIIVRFQNLLLEENKALQEFNFDMVAKLYDQKSNVVNVYRNMVAFFIRNQDALREAEGEQKSELKELSINLDALIKENDVLLKTRMETSKTVMDSIVNIAKVTNNANSTSYGAQGNYSPLDNNHNALAINRTL